MFTKLSKEDCNTAKQFDCMMANLMIMNGSQLYMYPKEIFQVRSRLISFKDETTKMIVNY